MPWVDSLFNPADTNAYRCAPGINAPDAPWPFAVDRLGDVWLLHGDQPPDSRGIRRIRDAAHNAGVRGVFFRLRRRDARGRGDETSPEPLDGTAPPDRFGVLENGLHFLLSLTEGYSTGLFLDQRETRRRLARNRLPDGSRLFPKPPAACEVLNTFAYTCSLDVAAAAAGARTTNLDLSRKYLDWGRANYEANGLNPAHHDFIYGDAFQWMRRLANKGRRFDLVILDPPTFSTDTRGRAFRVEHDYARLVERALPLLAPGGTLVACANTHRWPASGFRRTVREALGPITAGARETVLDQPPDFSPPPGDGPYLKTVVWRTAS